MTTSSSLVKSMVEILLSFPNLLFSKMIALLFLSNLFYFQFSMLSYYLLYDLISCEN